MAQLQNTIYNFPQEQVGLYNIRDFTRNNIFKIKDLPESNDSTYVTYISLEDNQTIEGVSYILYDNENYWDILLALNDIDPLYGMTYDFDAVTDISISEADKMISKYGLLNKLNSETNQNKIALLEARISYIYSYFLDKINTQNDTQRIFKVIRPDRISDYIKVLRLYGYAQKV